MDDKILNTLRKVLALTTSPVEGEAQAAAGKLQELLTKHNLSMADLETRGKAEPAKVEEDGHDLGKAAFTWKLNLAEGIAEFYFCYPIVSRARKTVVFVGRKDNVESLKMLYGWLIDQIRRISAVERKEHQSRTGEHIDPLRWQVNFGIGATRRLVERLREKAEREREANKNVTALVVHHKSEISDYLEKMYGFRTDGKKTEREKAREKEREEHEKAMVKLKEEDIEAYYRLRPWEKPLTPEEQAKADKEQRRREKQWAKRKGRTIRYRLLTEEEIRKMEQGDRSRNAGYKAGDKVNIEPFVENQTKKRESIG